jgi:membrane protease YdiL (CAAX protease family)
LLLAWRYYGTPEFFAECFASSAPGETDPAVAGAICHFVSCFLMMGLLPALVVKFVFRERLRDYGVGLGIGERTWRTFRNFAPIFLVAGYVASRDPIMLEKFPINPQAGQSASMFALHIATYFLYYVGWEFYFRGFMLFGLRDSVGDANAVLIQTLASALLHIGSPPAETFGAILGGLLWGMIAVRTRSMLSGFGQHFLLGITLDTFICYG